MRQRTVHALVLYEGALACAVFPCDCEHQHVEYERGAYHCDDVHENDETGIIRFACEHRECHCHEEAQEIAEHDVSYAFQQQNIEWLSFH